MATATQAPVYTAAQNLSDRMLLLNTGIPIVKKVGTFGPFQPGSTNRIKLLNVGVTTGLDVRTTATITNGGTVAATPSPLAPYNFYSKIATLDYNTQERVFTPSIFMYALNSIRAGRIFMGDGQGAIDTDQVAQGGAVGTSTLTFPMYVPVAYNAAADLRGALDTQMSTGDCFFVADIPATSVGGDSDLFVTTASAAPVVSDVYIEVWQHYIQPQVINPTTGLPVLPLIDLGTGYEFACMFQTSSDLNVNSPKYLDYPNVRQVLSAFLMYDNGGVLTPNQTDISSINIVVGAATTTKEMSPRFIRGKMREAMGGDLPSGIYYLGTRNSPVEVTNQAIVQIKVTPAAVAAGAKLFYGYESFYMTGQQLPGIAG